MKVAEAQILCLKQGIPFYSYRLPGESDRFLGAQLDGKVIPFDRLTGEENGFVIVPFRESEKVSPWFIREDCVFRNVLSDSDLRELLTGERGMAAMWTDEETDVDQEEYEKQVATLVNFLRNGGGQKVVLSRTLTFRVNAYEQAAVWFEHLEKRYPEAFVFLVFVPGELCWLGATPEVFMRQSEQEMMTMALAGTRPKAVAGEWGEKEKEEQAMVARYVKETLTSIDGEGWMEEGPFSKVAGGVEHLCTVFRRHLALTVEQTDRLRRKLHPTPAVGGLPVEEALAMIQRVEQRDRRYYAGYLGPLAENGRVNWFVNLRCMELWPDRIRLSVGGGITAQSDPAREWEETELKSRTLLDVVQVFVK